MNIKHIKNAFGFAFAAIFFVGCTDVESINDVDLNQTIKTDEYFAGPGEEGVARDVIALSELKGNPLLHDLSCALTLPELAAYLRMLNGLSYPLNLLAW